MVTSEPFFRVTWVGKGDMQVELWDQGKASVKAPNDKFQIPNKFQMTNSNVESNGEDMAL